jgi:hypothetical protein
MLEMINCPNCQHQELPGALFCSECGAQLVAVDLLTLPLENQGATDKGIDVIKGDVPVQTIIEKPVKTKEAVIKLVVPETGQTLQFSGKIEYSLGRIAKDQPILPDVDLSEFDAYEKGVSRIHAAIKITGQRVVILDLRSANGTRINGQKITPNVEYPLKSGDIITLGRLPLQFILDSLDT